MIRLIALSVLISVACRWIFGKWPWEYLKPAQTRHRALSEARKLLGVQANAGPREIREAHRQVSAMVHPDRGGSNAQMQELNAARDLLLKEQSHQNSERPE